MVRIRLRRVGSKKQPSFRVVVADKESPRDGKFIEIVGQYNPRTEPATIILKEDRIFDWMSKGAQPSDSFKQIMVTAGTWDRYERFKKGEELETLLAEAKAAEEARNVDPRTRRDDLMEARHAEAAKRKAAEEKAAAEAAAKAEAEAAAAAEAEAKAAAEAEAAAAEEASSDEAVEETEAPAEEAAEEAADEAEAAE